MIHGISRQIIEMKETGNVYYKSAYLVVKPKYVSAERELLEHEVHKILRSIDAPSDMKRARGISLWVTRVVPPTAVAAAAAILYSATIQTRA